MAASRRRKFLTIMGRSSITANAPALVPRTWYGMPAYAKDGKVICFFRSAEKFKERYMTLGFNDGANLDEGPMWPIVFALIVRGCLWKRR